MNLLRTLTLANAASVALALSDGTPVELVKVTRRDRLQVRIPASHALGQVDPLRIFDRDGNHYKNATGGITLVATAVDASASAAAPAAAPAPAADTAAAAPAPAQTASNDNVTYQVDGQDYANLDDAKAEAIEIFRDTGETVEIVAVTTKVVGTVGFSLAA